MSNSILLGLCLSYVCCFTLSQAVAYVLTLWTYLKVRRELGRPKSFYRACANGKKKGSTAGPYVYSYYATGYTKHDAESLLEDLIAQDTEFHLESYGPTHFIPQGEH